ncbi:MAG: hypothetical protein ACKV2U_31655 [Bryobacteraceae bacterium]
MRVLRTAKNRRAVFARRRVAAGTHCRDLADCGGAWVAYQLNADNTEQARTLAGLNRPGMALEPRRRSGWRRTL